MFKVLSHRLAAGQRVYLLTSGQRTNLKATSGMSSKWKNRQRRSEVRTRQSGRRHGASGEIEELLAGFMDVDENETGSLSLEKVVMVMKNKGYSTDYAESYWEANQRSKDESVSLDDFKAKLKACPIAVIESEIARLKRIFDVYSKCAPTLPDKAIFDFKEDAEKSSRIFRSDMRKAIDEAKRTEKGELPFEEIENFLREKGSHFNASEEENLENLFRAMDKDGNGQLTLNEIVDMMERRGYPSIFARVFLDALDEDGDFVVTLEEFKRMLVINPISLLDSSLAQLHRLFRLFDKDGSDYIDHQDLASYIEEAEQVASYFTQAVKEAVSAIDTNKDGRISFDELSSYIRKQVPRAPMEEEEHLEKKFREVMEEESESLEIKRVSKLMYDEGYRQNFTKRFLDELDVKNDKLISIGEFKSRMRDVPIPLEDASSANLNRLFDHLDKDQRGSLLEEDLTTYLDDPQLCPTWFRTFVKSILETKDRSFDKRISYRQLSDGLRSAGKQLTL